MSGRGRATAVVVALGVGAAVAAGGAWAQTAAAQAVKDRQANFKQLGGAFKALNDQLKSDKPDMAVIKASALKMKALAAQEPTWFPAGSGPEAGVKTAAKPQIWSDAAGFAARVKTRLPRQLPRQAPRLGAWPSRLRTAWRWSAPGSGTGRRA
jgi:cytochrome c556